MSESKYRKFYVDWWNIRRSSVYLLIAVIILGAGLIWGVSYASRNNWFTSDEQANVPKDAASIISFEGDVRITRAATRDTIVVKQPGTYVAEGDTIQTQSDGRCIVQMIDGSTYSVRPNSTVVVKTSTSLFGGKNVRVTLDDGQLNVRTDAQPDDVNNIVEVADSESRILPKTDASFNADQAGGEIRISRGGVETTIGGEKTTITENEFASVNNGKLSARERLMTPPRPVQPGNSAQVVDSGGGVAVTFAWADAEGNPAANYHLQVSRSPTFASDSIMVDRGGMTSREFRLSGLAPGNYYWRIKATGRTGQATNWHDAWKFMVVRSGERVSIDATEWRVERVGGNVYLISGRTQPGMAVRAAGRDTFAGADGTFRLQISSTSVETAVEVGDDRGNRSGFIISLRNGNVLRRY